MQMDPHGEAEGLDTFPKLLFSHAARRPDRPASREKEFGIWRTWSWREVADHVIWIAEGLAAEGFTRGDKLAIVGDNRPELYWSMAAAQALGGVPVPLYQDSVADEIAYVLEHADARFAIAEDQEQVDKLLSLRERCPRLEHIVYEDPRGMRAYDAKGLSSLSALVDVGRARTARDPERVRREVERGRGSDVSILLYTSGTTGRPKGVVLSYDNILRMARIGVELEGLTEREEVLAYLPMAWVGDHVFSYAQSLVAGFCVSCPEAPGTVLGDLRELGPTYFFAPPRIFENLLTTVTIRMHDASAPKRRLYEHFMAVARRVGADKLDGRPVALADRLRYALGEILVYGPLKNVLGLSRVRLAYTAGEAIGPDLFAFYRALGINLKQLYGQTEGAVFVTIQPDGEVYPDTVGRPAPGVEIDITESGEVRYRSPGVFLEYHRQPEATAATKTPDGWVMTGDAGFFDERGHLRIIDRAKDVGRLGDGAMFAPKYIENKLKFFADIREAVAFGDGRSCCCAFLNMDLAAMASWAERHGVAFSSYQELAAHPRVYEILRGHVEAVNRDLAREPRLAPSQIRRFLVLPKELDADDGELTRTRKLRRNVIEERYAPLVEALYAGAARCDFRTDVTFEDGRKGTLRGDVRIENCATFAGDGSRA